MSRNSKRCFLSIVLCLTLQHAPALGQQQPAGAQTRNEYLWYEAENMEGVARDARNEPRVYPSHVLHARANSPGWGMNGPGVSAEWSQGGESEWNSVAASPDEVKAELHQDLEIPRDGDYRVWARYADWTGKSENFIVRLTQGGREVLRHEFGAQPRVDAHDEAQMYWGWAFAWDSSRPAPLKRGSARLTVEIERAADARRHVDCLLLTNDPAYTPEGRRKPPFAAQRVLTDWAAKQTTVAPLIDAPSVTAPAPALWRRPPAGGRDFLVPWNVAEKFWELYDSTPPEQRPLYPFHAEPAEAFIEKYKGARDVPIFASRLIVPVVYIRELPKHLKEGSAFLRYLRETRAPFAVLINYGEATFPEGEGAAAWKLLNGELREQFLGWISGESIGHVWSDVAQNLVLTPQMSRREMLDKYRLAYTAALERRWRKSFGPEAAAMWDKLIPAQSTSSTSYAHALAAWGVRTLALETAAVMPNYALRVAFTRGAARQYGANFLYYHAPNFGDSALIFTKHMSYAGPDYFYHTRYGASMGPSLSWYRKSYYLYYMAGASEIYLEQGFDQFFKPGPGEHPFQLNPVGRVTDEFVRFAEKHPDRGTPYTPVAFLLDPAHGFEMTDWPHLPFGVSPFNRGDRALRELFGAAYHPALETEGEPATADRQAFVNGVFGDLFDVLVADDARRDAADAYRALFVGGRVEWSPAWAKKLQDYARAGGTVVVNAAQVKGLPAELLGVRLLGATAEADDAACLSPGEARAELAGPAYRYERVELRGAEALMQTPSGDPLVTVNKVGRGRVVFSAVPDLLGLDERLTPSAAHLLVHLLADASPVRVRGDVQRLVNRTERGWVVTLINNRGVYKPQYGLAETRRDEFVDVTLDLRGRGIERATEWTEDAPAVVTRDGGADVIRLRVPPGGVRVVEILPRR